MRRCGYAKMRSCGDAKMRRCGREELWETAEDGDVCGGCVRRCVRRMRRGVCVARRMCGEVWRGVARCGEVWRGVARCGEVWRGVARCGEVWRGVADAARCGEVWRVWRVWRIEADFPPLPRARVSHIGGPSSPTRPPSDKLTAPRSIANCRRHNPQKCAIGRHFTNAAVPSGLVIAAPLCALGLHRCVALSRGNIRIAPLARASAILVGQVPPPDHPAIS